MVHRELCALALGGILALTVTTARSDDSALLDVLVKKGILTQKEAEKLEAQISEEPAPVQQDESVLYL